MSSGNEKRKIALMQPGPDACRLNPADLARHTFWNSKMSQRSP